MKKVILSVFSVMLVFSFVLTLCACGNEKDEFVGTWKGEVDLSKQFKELFLEDSDPEAAKHFDFSNLKIVMDSTFEKDGTYIFKADKELLEESLKGLSSDMKKGFESYLSKFFSIGPNKTLDEELKREPNNTTLDEVVDNSMDDAKDIINSMVEELESSGQYDAKAGKLYTFEKDSTLDENKYITYEISDTQLKLIKTYGENADKENEFYPIVLNKQ